MDSEIENNPTQPGGSYFDREAEIQGWVNPLVCPVHHQHPKVAIRGGKIGLIRPCCKLQKDMVVKELRKHMPQ